MKVFLSHKQKDAALASRIRDRLRKKGIESYLDVFDKWTSKLQEDDLSDYLRRQMSECSHLMVVVSSITNESWWVPWEIGVACERLMPLATYAGEACDLPSYLCKWPYLESMLDVDRYAHIAGAAQPTIMEKRGHTDAYVRSSYANKFHRQLKTALGQ